MTDHDAIVVGAGPAGSMAAWELATAGWRVLLLDRHRFPRDKACGGALTKWAVSALPFSIESVVERETPWYLSNASSRSAVFTAYRNPPLLITCRATLDNFLVERAVGRGARFQQAEAVESIVEDDGVLRVTTPAGTYRSPRVILAAGGGLGLDGQGRLRATGAPEAFALEGTIKLRNFVSASGVARVVEYDYRFPAAGYAWIFPLQGALNVGLATIRCDMQKLTRKMVLDRFAAVANALGSEVINVRGAPLAIGGLSYMPRGRVLRVGDAAGFTSDASGEGISSAIVSGRLAGRALVEARRTGADPAELYFASLRPVRRWLKEQARLAGGVRMHAA